MWLLVQDVKCCGSDNRKGCSRDEYPRVQMHFGERRELGREQESGFRGARRSTWVERIAVRSWFTSWLSFVISTFCCTEIKKLD